VKRRDVRNRILCKMKEVFEGEGEGEGRTMLIN
jgi:hypothetical protein